MGRVDFNKINLTLLDEEIDPVETFQKIKKRKRFDDNTVSTKTGRKKKSIQRGKEELEEIEE